MRPGDGKHWLLYSNLPIGVGGHGTFNLRKPELARRACRATVALDCVVRACFLDAYLRDDADAKAWLASGNAEVLAGEADWVGR